MVDVTSPVPAPRPVRRPAPTVRGALLAMLAVLGLLGACGLAGWRAGAARAASLSVTGRTTGSPIPQGFLGISTETQDLEQYAGTTPDSLDPAFIHLLGAIAPGQRPVLRIGGDSTDWSWYPVRGQHKPPGVTYTLTPRWLQVARATAQEINGKLILGVNLEADDRADAVGEADAMVHTIGRKYIDAIEIGNEPELYHHFAWYRTRSGAPVFGRPASWSPAEYRAQFASYARAMPKVPIAGPVSGFGSWLDQLGTFLDDEPSVALTTMHAYPLKHCTPSHVVTIPEVLADSASQGFVSQVTPYVRVARAHHKPIRIDEVNAISCGGTAGVSDSFASALWMENTLFGLAQTGVGGVNVHMVAGAINSILNPVRGGGIAVQPEYYAMIMFAQAAPPGSRILHLDAALAPGEEAWATRDPSGTVRLVLINRSPNAAATTSVSVPGLAGPASVESLRAPGLAATQNVSLGGASFGRATSTGELTGATPSPALVATGGRYAVTVPPASAELLTFPPPASTLLASTLRAHRLLSPLISSW